VSFEVHGGEIFGLIGPNGAGMALLVSTPSILVGGLSHRQPGARRALRAADRRACLISDDRPLGPLCSGRVVPAGDQTVARPLPLTYVVSLLKGIWSGDAWSTHVGDVGALAVVFVACAALSARVFRWE